MAAQEKSIFYSSKVNKESSLEALFDSIRKDDEEVFILTILLEGVDIDVRNSDGYTPLLLASKYRRKTIVQLLIDSGAKIDNSVCKEKRTLLHYASEHGWTEIVKTLVKSFPVQSSRDSSTSCEESTWPLIHAGDMFGKTALHLASICGHLEVVKCLVEEGADLDARSKSGWTALQCASNRGHLEVVKFLVEKRANLNAKNNNGQTALHMASGRGYLEVVKCLVNGGADMEVDSFGTPLLWAARKSYKDVVCELINSGANVEHCEDYGWTLLHYASLYGWIEIVKSIVNRVSVLPSIIVDRKGIVSCEKSTYSTIHVRDPSGRTALHLAASFGHLEIVKCLVESGVDVNARATNGATALLSACKVQEMHIVEYLLQVGARGDIPDYYGKFPLNYITKLVSPLVGKIIELCIETGAYLLPIDYNQIINTYHWTINSSGLLFYDRFTFYLLQDVKFCCQAIINNFNGHDLPSLYKLPVARSLPHIEKMIIVSGSKMAQAIERSVKHEIDLNGHCNVLSVRPIVLGLFSVKSILEYYNNKKADLPKGLKRSAASNV